MNIFDIAIVLLIILSAISGAKQGFLRALVNVVVTIIVYVVAYHLKDKVGVLLCKVCPFFSFDGYQTLNILLYQMLAFILIAFVLYSIFSVILKVTGIVQRLIDLTFVLKLPSNILGFVVGLLEGYIVMFIVVAVLAVPFKNMELYTSSKVVDTMLYKSPVLSDTLGGVVNKLSGVLNVTTKLESNEEAQRVRTNMDIMGTYLDCKIISKEDALEIIDMDKFESIPGLRQYVDAYQEK